MHTLFAQSASANTLAPFIQLAGENVWQALTPEIGVAVLALAVLVFELTLPEKWRHFIPNGVLIGLLGLTAGLLTGLRTPVNTAPAVLFGGLVTQTRGVISGGMPSTTFLRMFFLVSAFFVVWLGVRFLEKRQLPRTEFLHIVLVVTAALMLLVQSNHFVLLFVALETVTVGFYVLTGYNRGNVDSLEAGVKYLVSGGVSSALMLFGIVLLYGTAGNPVLNGGASGADALGFSFLAEFISAHPANPLVLAGVALVTGGIAFKIGMFPFQIWVPDVYQGAPMPTTAFLAVASKTAGILTLLILVNGPFSGVMVLEGGSPGPLYWLLSVMTGATLIFSNLTALGQVNVKRLMGLSGISHAGFMLLAVLASQTETGHALAVPALAVYLVAYLAGAFATFGVMNEMAEDEDASQSTADFQLLPKRNPFLAGILGCGLGSLAGIPPSLGFVAKFLVITAAFASGLWWLSAVALLCVGAGVYYYFAWLREAFQRMWLSGERVRELAEPVQVPLATRLALGCLALVILVGGVARGVVDAFW
ncbi:MAG: NADH-quinone oxidoreductase subunit N [Puniceicoccales bacterium]|jgi:NADH-quinone oxidoreductase subunit N|nr:NADH-quinone oxidoreductase subunit N [Puniceicoccales bacterium]